MVPVLRGFLGLKKAPYTKFVLVGLGELTGRIVTSSNAFYLIENQLFVKRSQYIRI